MRFRERQGVPGAVRPRAALLWVHAASVGEATAVLALIERLLLARPTLEILVTTGTVASARLLEGRLPARARHQFVPVDLPRWIARFLDHWRPDLALWVEFELWPNLVLATHARGIPMALVNARLSARSYARWRRWPGLIGPVLGAFSLCLAQDEEQAGRFRRLGAREVGVVGDLKAAAAALPVDRRQLDELAGRIRERPRWLAASTHAGEEEIAARVHHQLAASHPGLLTIIAPRHPARGDAIHAMLTARGLSVARRASRASRSSIKRMSISPTRWANSGCSTVLPGLPSSAGRLLPRAVTIRSRQPGSTARCCTGRIPAIARAWRPTWPPPVRPKPSPTPTGSRGRWRRFSTIRVSGPGAPPPEDASSTRSSGVLDAVLERLAPWLDPLAPARSFAEPLRSLRA